MTNRRETEEKEEMRKARREREGPKRGGEKSRKKQTEEDKWRRPYGSGTRKNSSVVANKRILQSIKNQESGAGVLVAGVLRTSDPRRPALSPHC